MISMEELLNTPDTPMSDNWSRHFDRCWSVGFETLGLEPKAMGDLINTFATGAPMTTKVHEHVYFIKSGSLIKIGKAINVTKRIGNYHTHNPDIEVLGVSLDTDEKALHAMFAHLRVKGEWFRDCAEIRQAIEVLECMSEDEVRLYEHTINQK